MISMMLKEFFVDENINIPFKLFGKTHWFLMILVLVGLILVYIKRKRIYLFPKTCKRKIVVIFAIILLLNMLTLYISSLCYQTFDYKTMLPFHLCYLANYFYILAVILNKEKWYPYIYFLSFLGPIPAILFFDVPSVFESFNFYLYVISHHLLVIMGLFTFYLYPKKVNFKYLIKLFMILNVIYFLMKIFNVYFDTNYFFSEAIPPFIIELLPFLKYFPVVIILEGMEIIIIAVLYLFFKSQDGLLKS